jgi:predicted CopG family antitoxin
MSTIAIDPDVKEKLDNLKLMKNESYNSVVKRLVEKEQEYKPMFPKEKKPTSKLTDEEFKAWLKKSIEEDKELLTKLGRE